MVILLLLLLAFPAHVHAQDRLEIVAAPTAPRIVEGEMIPVTIRGIYENKVALEQLTIQPTDRFDWVQLTKDDWRNERIDGRNRLVFERHLALFARRTGIAAFGPAEHDLTIINAASQREPVRIASHRLELTIAPLPGDAPFTSPNGWRFAARSLTLTDELSTRPDMLADGETVTRRVTLRAEGALPEMLPPRPVVSENWLITFAAPVERSLELTPEGPIATVVWTWQFRPETGEPGVLDPVPIPYFNTQIRKVEAVEIPALPIGYASFYETRDTGQIRLGGVAAIAGGVVAGAAVGLGVLLRGHRRVAGHLLRRLSPLPALRMWRARDPLTLRRAAEDWLALRPERRNDEALALIDAAIYAGAPLPEDILRRIRSRRSRPRPARGEEGPPPRS